MLRSVGVSLGLQGIAGLPRGLLGSAYGCKELVGYLEVCWGLLGLLRPAEVL